MVTTEASTVEWTRDLHSDAKPHGMRPQMRSGELGWPSGGSSVKKRSLRRAFRRSLRDGFCWYKGRSYGPQDFPKELREHVDLRQINHTLQSSGRKDLHAYNSQQTPKRRLSMMTWNAGGLSAHKLDDIRLWAHTQHLSVVTIVETRWTWTSEWEDTDWSYLHSNSSDGKGKGILIMIHKSLCKASNIRWHVISEGRLVHTQLRLDSRPLDLVSCYQYPYQSSSTCLSHRQTWWNMFDRTLHGMAHRNLLVISGDFNCSLPKAGQSAGTDRFRWQHDLISGPRHDDMNLFASILRTHHLTALNTWSSRLGPTYIKGSICSRIDFCIIRTRMADGCSKNVQYMWMAPFVSMNYDHCPILFNIKKCWFPESASGTLTCSAQQKLAGRTAFLEENAQWQRYMQASTSDLSAHLQGRDPHNPSLFVNITHCLMDGFNQFFPRQAVPKTPAWKKTQSWVAIKWRHRASMHSIGHHIGIRHCQLANLFRFWFHSTRFSVMTKQHKRFANQVRQQQFAEVVHKASQAASQHNSFQLFRIINAYAPKQPKRRMQLRNKNGQLANRVEEHAILCQYVLNEWQGPAFTIPHIADVAGTPFAESDLLKALETIPISKAVAPGYAPGFLWRAHASLLAPWLYSVLQCWWLRSDPFIPEVWKHGWLCWLPKPGRAPVSASALRPIALQDPVGKAVAGLLCSIGQRDSLHSMIHWPLWAYLPHRSTIDSLARVTQHCVDACLLVESQRSTPASRAAHQPRHRVCGGIQLLVDLTRAFDTLNRDLLFGRLHRLGVRSSIIQLLSHWHSDTKYIISTDDLVSEIPVYKGVRQGCKMAPWLWNSVMTLLLEDLSTSIDPEWLRRCVNLYADDCQAGDTFCSEADLQQILHNFGHILHMLEQYGLKINEQKSVILLTLTGPGSKALRRKLLHGKPGHECLCVQKDQSLYTIPVATQAKYLGVIVSYHHFASKTVDHRLQLANIAFRRLTCWLRGRKGLAIKQRLQLWHSCIVPIATYGIFSTGFTASGASKVCRHFHRMLRFIICDHSHVTRHSNADALARFHIAHPYLQLWTCVDRLIRSTTQRIPYLSSNDLARHINWSHLIRIQTMLSELHRGLTAPASSIGSEAGLHSCLFCDFRTASVAALRRHCNLEHNVRTYRTTTVKYADHMIDGLPTCKHCLASFSSWRSFQHHLERGCQVHRPTVPLEQPAWPRMPLLPTRLTNAASDKAVRGTQQLTAADLRHLLTHEWGQRLLTLISSKQVHQLEHEPVINEFLSQRCCLCSQWVGRAQEMHKHLRLFHSQYWPLVMARSTQLTHKYVQDSPCQFCQSNFKSSHSCNVWTQVSLLIIYGAGSMDVPADGGQGPFTCELCGESVPDAESLHAHLIRAHQLSSARWNPSRDSIDGTSGCAHCGQVFGSLSSLRSHIVQGRCSMFAPDRTCEPLDLNPKLVSILCSGGFTDAMQDNQFRQQMTLHCQCCNLTYQRGGDLMLHLQSSHSKLWHESTPLTHLLTGILYHDTGCLCNPSIKGKRLNHTCIPIRQLAMQFCRFPPGSVLMPFVVTDELLQKVYHETVLRSLKFALDTCLITRDFETLIRDTNIMKLLGTNCLICGQVMDPLDLGLHLREAHHCTTPLVVLLLEQLMVLLISHNPVDHVCTHCGMVFNIPLHMAIGDNNDHNALADRVTLARYHYRAHCPCSLQLAVAVCRVLNDGHLSHDSRFRCLGSDHGVLSQDDAPFPGRGQNSELGTQSGIAETSAKRSRKQEQKGPRQTRQRTSREPRPSPSPDGKDASQVGPGNSTAEKGGHIYLLLQQSGSGQRHPLPSDGGREMESSRSAGAETCPSTTFAPGSDPGLALGAPDTSDQALRIGSKVRDDLPGHAGEHPATRSHLPVSRVGCPESSPPGELTDAPVAEKDDSEHPGTGGDVYRSKPGTGLLLTPQDGEHAAVAPADEYSCGPPVPAHEESGGLGDLDAPSCLPEGPHTDTECSGSAVGTVHGFAASEDQGQGQRQADEAGTMTMPSITTSSSHMLDCLAHGSLANPDNWCFANSAVLAVLWSFLSLSIFDVAFWGDSGQQICRFISRLSSTPSNLTYEHWFSNLLQSWGRPDILQSVHSISQHDAAEFVSHWFQQLGNDVFNMAWERRMENAERTHVVDESSSSLPLMFQFDSVTLQLRQFSLDTLCTSWHQADGMIAALTYPARGLCIHVDRCVKPAEDEPVHRCLIPVDCEDSCAIPVFQHHGLDVDLVDYTITAIQAHTGTDNSGHYRTAVRIRPTVSRGILPAAWLLMDDWMTPTPVWMLPRWFVQHANVFYLIRNDVLSLHEYADSIASGLNPSQCSS